MKIKNILTAFAFAMLVPAMVGCSDDKDLVPLTATSGGVTNIDYTTLTFRWEKVTGAVQYSYQLTQTDNGKILNTNVTPFTSASFNDLEPDTEYTLTVYAYAAMDSDNTTSEPIVITGRTKATTELASPIPTMTRDGNIVEISWEETADAIWYEWFLKDGTGTVVKTEETYDTSITFTDLTDGNYTFSVIARTDIIGYGDSQPGTLDFNFVKEIEKLTIDDLVGEWTLNGTYDYYGDDYTETTTVTFTKLSDNTMEVGLPNVYKDYGIATVYGTMTIDFDAQTFTIEPYIGYYEDAYNLAGTESNTSPITGTISKNAITITNFGIWYDTENDLDSFTAVYSR